jgi:hypothetical protein
MAGVVAAVKAGTVTRAWIFFMAGSAARAVGVVGLTVVEWRQPRTCQELLSSMGVEGRAEVRIKVRMVPAPTVRAVVAEAHSLIRMVTLAVAQ